MPLSEPEFLEGLELAFEASLDAPQVVRVTAVAFAEVVEFIAKGAALVLVLFLLVLVGLLVRAGVGEFDGEATWPDLTRHTSDADDVGEVVVVEGRIGEHGSQITNPHHGAGIELR